VEGTRGGEGNLPFKIILLEWEVNVSRWRPRPEAVALGV